MKELEKKFFHALTGVISIIAISLFIYNRSLANKVIVERKTNAELRDTLFDIRMKYDGLFDEVLRLEYENQILGSIAAEKEMTK